MILDWVLSMSSVVVMWLMGNKWRYAPLVGFCRQMLWIYYVCYTKHWGLLLGVLINAIIDIRNLIKWNKNGK